MATIFVMTRGMRVTYKFAYLDCGRGLTGLCTKQTNKFYSLNICCLLYVNYIAIRFFFVVFFLKKSLGGLEDQAQGYAAKNNHQVKLQNQSCKILEP